RRRARGDEGRPPARRPRRAPDARAGARRVARRRSALRAVDRRRPAASSLMAETIWADDWESLGEEDWQGGARSRPLPRGDHLGATLYELPPGATGGLYHFHHGAEELLVMLRGRATLRPPAGAP